MNAYLMQDNEDHYVVIAKSMQEAVAQAERVYVSETYTLDELDTPEVVKEAQAEFRSTLQSCALVGPVK